MPAAPNQGFTYREQIGAVPRGETALSWLTRRHTHSTEAEWRARIEGGEVAIADRPVSPDDPLPRGAWLTWQRPPWIEPDAPLSFAVVFEDDDLVAVDKPSGLPTLPGGGFLEHTLLAQVRRTRPGADPMHRLGRGTSGIVLFAKSPESAAALQQAWRAHEVRKVYRALASGLLERDVTIDTPIGPVAHATLGEIFAASPTGKHARSHVKVISRRVNDTLVDVEIETGRPHQIRIHLASIGHPLTGDPLYGPGGVPRDDALPGDLGYLLHARLLAFTHPRSGQRVELACEPPAALL